MEKLYIEWAKEYVDIIEDKYYATYASRAFADYSEYIWPAGPFDTYERALLEATSHLCDDDTCNVLFRKDNKWWKPETKIDIKCFPERPRMKRNGFIWVETK